MDGRTREATGWTSRLRSLAPLPLRLALGFGLLYHGHPKLFTADGHAAAADMLASIGLPAPGLTAYLLGLYEFFGGILLALGVIVRLLALIGAVEMVVAAAFVHWPSGFDFVHVLETTPAGEVRYGLPGYEVNVVYLAGFLSLLLSGAGALGLPSVRGPRDAHREPVDVAVPAPGEGVPSREDVPTSTAG